MSIILPSKHILKPQNIIFLQKFTPHYIPLHPTTSHYIPLHPTTSHYTPLHPTTSHYIPPLLDLHLMTTFYGARPDRTSPFGRIATGCIAMYPASLITQKMEKGVRFVMVITLYLWLIIVDLWILVLAQTWCIEHCKKALPAIRLATVHCQSLEPRRGSLARWGFPLLRKSWPKRSWKNWWHRAMWTTLLRQAASLARPLGNERGGEVVTWKPARAHVCRKMMELAISAIWLRESSCRISPEFWHQFWSWHMYPGIIKM